MDFEDRFSSIFQAIQALYDDDDIDLKEDANSFISEWQYSSNSIEDSIEILSVVEDPHIIFVMIKTIQTHIRFYWDKINDKEDIIIETLLNLVTKDYILQIHQDFIFICLSDIANQTGELYESVLESIPNELIFRFFSFFYENWHEPFIRFSIQPNYLSIGFELLQENEVCNEWLRIMKVFSAEIHEIDHFIPFFQQLIEVDISIDENHHFLNDIISNFCDLNFLEFEQFEIFLNFFVDFSKKFTSPFIWIPLFEMRNDFFDVNEENALNLIESVMNEFFEFCLNEEFESDDSDLLWVDLISVSFSFFIEYNSIQMIQYQFNFMNLILSLLSSLSIKDDEISFILLNLHELNAFNEFIQSQQKSLSFYTIIAYNSHFVPIELIHQISTEIFIENKNEEFTEIDYLLLSFIEKTYSLLKDNFSDQFLVKINELFPLFPNKSSKTLYSIVSKNYTFIDESYFELFHSCIEYESPFIIPSLLFLLKEENNGFYSEIDSKISELIDNSNINDFISFIYSMIKKFPRNIFPFHSSFFNEFSNNLIDLLIQISMDSNDEIINDKIVEIFSVILQKEYINDFSCFVNWIDDLMEIEDRINEHHIDFISNFDVFLLQNSKTFFEQMIRKVHELSFKNINESDLFKSILDLMVKTSFENSIDMWSIFPIQFLFDALRMKNKLVLDDAQIIISNNIKEESASSFINLLVSHLFSDENKLSVVLLLSSISRKMNSEKYIAYVVNSFPFDSDILSQFIPLLINPINIPQLLSLAQQLIQFYSERSD